MPLSEEELRLLEQMERAISAEDPKFASALQGTTLRRAQRRRAIAAGLVLAGGIALLMTGVISGLSAIGVLGFLVMVGATSIGVSAIRGRPAPMIGRPHLPRRETRMRSSFIDRSGRWRRRRGDSEW